MFFCKPAIHQLFPHIPPISGTSYLPEVIEMSPKELMYIEDALSHEQFLAAQCQQAAQSLQNPQLRQYVTELANKHNQLFKQLYQLV